MFPTTENEEINDINYHFWREKEKGKKIFICFYYAGVFTLGMKSIKK